MISFKELREKTLTPAEKKKREEIAKAIERDDPDMPMDKKMAIATATAKRVAEYGGPKISKAEYLKKGKEYHSEAYYRGQRKATPKKQEPPKMGSKSSSGYDLYHKSYSAAMQHAYAWAKKKGHEVDMDDVDRQVAMGPKKPSDGKTNSFTLKLKNNPKKKLAVQVYGMGGGKYELNTYIT